MKLFKKLFTVFAILAFSAFTVQDSTYRTLEQNNFGPGEVLNYRIHYGIFNAAKATMTISDKIYKLNNRPCYRIDIQGRTSGAVEVFYQVDDRWGSYMDTAALIPHRFYRFIKENRYRKNEIVDFNHKTGTALVTRLSKDSKRVEKKDKYDIPKNVLDLVSGYYFFRTLDFDQYEPGDQVDLSGFFDDEVYEFKIRYLRKEKVRTKLGKMDAYVIAPIMPDNEIFDGEDSIEAWISADKNRIPLKIKAKMFIGAVEVDITSVDGLKNELGEI
ncbi:DUF3108 domain-containing protein [Mangrovivirga cuniculi]|uniref:DUF3108 domain-containing protein n=1 Tax=Mangrovivirga cuniculi TaxID=2715131 RepID=A0A4D7JFP1_9BACT|nr:DUF3108 domain-containing protein [Mangrovivirga cuniculi]QCK13933.1 DUF3108 domain-containing protein [Mangrovivirga cuniculi]